MEHRSPPRPRRLDHHHHRRHDEPGPRLGRRAFSLAALGALLGPRRGEGRVRYRLVFEDTFAGGSLNTDRWNDTWSSGRCRTVNGEIGYFAPGANASPADGGLRIRAEPEPAGDNPCGDGFWRTGMIKSRRTFRYGRFEIRMKVPAGKGYWPAFWLADDRSEIDIVEILGREPGTAHFTVHWGGYGAGHRQSHDHWHGPDFSADYHTFRVDWGPKQIVWYVDGVERRRLSKSLDRWFVLIANLSVGGHWAGYPDGTTPAPGDLSIAYVRVWERSAS